MSLLNLDHKITSKAFVAILKHVLPDLMSSQQTEYIAQRFTGESTGLISDLLEISDKLKFNGYLVTINNEKLIRSIMTL